MDRFLQDREKSKKAMRIVRSKPAPAPVRNMNYGCYPPLPAYQPNEDPTAVVDISLHEISAVLYELDLYQPLYLGEKYVPTQRGERAKFIALLKRGRVASCPTILFYHHRGGSQCTEYFIFKCDPEHEDHVRHQEKVIAQLVENFPVILSREDRRRIRKEMDYINGLPHKKAQEAAYRLLVKGGRDKKVITISPGLEATLHAAMQLDDPEILQSIQVMGGMPLGATSYDAFWAAVEVKYNKLLSVPAVHSRRADGTSYLPPDVEGLPRSLRDMFDQVVEELPDGELHPRERWFRQNFDPIGSNSLSSLLHGTGRFNVKWRIQGHHLRTKHEDDAYGREMRHDLEELMILQREVAVNVNQDDKKKSALGPPNLPQAATGRTRHVVSDVRNLCADHDYGCGLSLITSVTFIADIPGSREESFREGQVWATIKRSLDEGSSPFRHSVELIHCFRDAGLMAGQRGDPLVLGEAALGDFGSIIKYHDGGQDHNTTTACKEADSLHWRIFDYWC